MSDSDYLKYRGKCKEMSEAAVAADPSLTLVRGHYECPWWGSQAHWWTVHPDGSIFDPTKDQFPSKGVGKYVPFDGKVYCAECDSETTEDKAFPYGNYMFCQERCAAHFVGVFS